MQGRLLGSIAIAALVFAGFGCRPVLDARVQKEAEKPSPWIVEPPHYRYELYPDGTGKVFLDLRTRPNTTVSVTLTGPGVNEEPTQIKTVDAEGGVRFKWETKRVGKYEYAGTIVFNQIIVETFQGAGDVF